MAGVVARLATEVARPQGGMARYESAPVITYPASDALAPILEFTHR